MCDGLFGLFLKPEPNAVSGLSPSVCLGSSHSPRASGLTVYRSNVYVYIRITRLLPSCWKNDVSVKPRETFIVNCTYPLYTVGCHINAPKFWKIVPKKISRFNVITCLENETNDISPLRTHHSGRQCSGSYIFIPTMHLKTWSGYGNAVQVLGMKTSIQVL